MSSVFGNNVSGAASNIFGNNTNTSNTTTGASLFSNPTSSAPSGGSLSASTSNTNTAGGGSGLFGSTQQNNPNTNTGSSNIFGAPANNSQQQQPQPHQSSTASTTFPGFNPLTTHFPPSLTLPEQTTLARTRLTQAGLSPPASENTIYDQTRTLLRKWDPQSQDTLLQAYLYNAVSAAYAPFYSQNQDETEREWERALSDAPVLSEETGQRMVPVLVRGFFGLGQRVEYQASFVENLRGRLHEMSRSLEAIMSAHSQRISINLEVSRRRHAALAQRTLGLAVKCQVLRNRGYALDAQEEGLRKVLVGVGREVGDPGFGGREEEVWARMVSLRERARWLEEEGKRVGRVVQEQVRNGGGGGGVPEEVLERTKVILRDYDGQLRHLGKELGEVGREYAEWEGLQQQQRERR